jgi:hypothetical protein
MAGDSGTGSSVDQPEFVAPWKFQIHFQQTAVGVDHQRERIGGYGSSVVQLSFHEQMDLKQDTLTSPARRGIGAGAQGAISTPQLGSALRANDFSFALLIDKVRAPDGDARNNFPFPGSRIDRT